MKGGGEESSWVARTFRGSGKPGEAMKAMQRKWIGLEAGTRGDI